MTPGPDPSPTRTPVDPASRLRAGEQLPALLALLDADPELGSGLEADELARARQSVVAPSIILSAGPWVPADVAAQGDDAFGLLLVDGLITREVRIGGRRAAQLLGPGDVLELMAPADGLLPTTVEWRAEHSAILAALDQRFLTATRRWPTLGLALHQRLAAQTTRLSVHAAIAQLGRVELRVLALLWHLAERFGVVTPAGVVVPFALTHAALGRLTGAQRPTVTLALTQLGASGDVSRRDDGAFVLRSGSQARLDGEDLPVGTAV